MIKIRRYTSDQIYSRPDVVARLKFLTNGGWGRLQIGSAFLEILQQELPDCDYFLAWDNGAIIGWALRQRVSTLDYFFRAGSPLTYYDTMVKFQTGVYVKRDSRGMGIGTRLLERVKSFHGPSCSNLQGAPWNEEGRHLFRKAEIPIVDSWV